MLKAAEDLKFEKAALLRDQIKELKRMMTAASRKSRANQSVIEGRLSALKKVGRATFKRP